MEARWISALVGGRTTSPILRASFFVFRVKVCRGGAQVVVAASHSIRAARLQPHLGGNIERLVGVVWSSRISSGCWDFRTVKEFHRSSYYLFVSGMDVVFFLPVRRLNQQCYADSKRSDSGGAPLTRSRG
jgi:hypothetical protein